jgi:outer membrane biosynthesis protein TonB
MKREIELPSNVPQYPVLRKELEVFSRKQNTKTGHTAYEAAKSTEHDDMVIACALAAWWATGKQGFTTPTFARPASAPTFAFPGRPEEAPPYMRAMARRAEKPPEPLPEATEEEIAATIAPEPTPQPSPEQQLEEKRQQQRELVAQLNRKRHPGKSEREDLDRRDLFSPEDFGM